MKAAPPPPPSGFTRRLGVYGNEVTGLIGSHAAYATLDNAGTPDKAISVILSLLTEQAEAPAGDVDLGTAAVRLIFVRDGSGLTFGSLWKGSNSRNDSNISPEALDFFRSKAEEFLWACLPKYRRPVAIAMPIGLPLTTVIPLTTGDQAGVAGGVVSDVGRVRNMARVSIGSPAPNSPFDNVGVILAPSQFKVLVAI